MKDHTHARTHEHTPADYTHYKKVMKQNNRLQCLCNEHG